MYEHFFRLTHMPFDIAPDPAFLFATPDHSEALAAITYGIEQRKGLVVLTGEVGLGKTTLLRTYLGDVDRSDLDIAYVLHPAMDFPDLLGVIGEAIGIQSTTGQTLFQQVSAIQQRLIERYRDGHNMAVIIDEAQRLPDGTLENLRLLSNLETENEKLIQIVLVGQPELDSHLQRTEMRQIAQRIALRVRLHPLDTESAIAYLRHRLVLAGAETPETVLSAAAMRRLAAASAGVPRVMNILADNTLIHAFAEQRAPASAAMVDVVVREYFEEAAATSDKPSTADTSRHRTLALAGAAFAIGVAIMAVAANGPSATLEAISRAELRSLDGEQLAGTKVPPGHFNLPADQAAPGPAAPPPAAQADLPPAPKMASAASLPEAAPSPADPAPRPVVLPLPEGLPDTTIVSTPVALPPPALLPEVPPVPPVAGETRHVVRVGDTLFQLVVRHYGAWTDRTRDLVLRRNPAITDTNLIWIGQPLAFPPAPPDIAPLATTTMGNQ